MRGLNKVYLERRVFAIIICFLFISCYSPKQAPKPLASKKKTVKQTVKQKVKFELLVKDEEGKLEGAKVDYKIFREGLAGRELLKEGSYITETDGVLVETIQGPLPFDFILDYKIAKDGYYPQSGSLKPEWSEEVNKVISKTVWLKRLPKHIYELSVINLVRNPIANAKIDYTIEMETTDGSKVIKNGKYITKADSRLIEEVLIDLSVFSTHFSYKVTKDGYYSKKGDMHLLTDRPMGLGHGYRPVTKRKSGNVIIIRPIDYFTPEFAKTVVSEENEPLFSSFVTWLRLESGLAKVVLELHSIDLISFKEKKYLTFKFVNATVYNSLKLSKYDIGGRLFDEVVRKILNPLNEYLGGSELFYGYDIRIVGHTKSFVDEYATPEEIEYRFMMPEPVVKAYKDKDITGEAVLNQSIILMDDERIELKLQ